MQLTSTLLALTLLSITDVSHGYMADLIEGLYCGRRNCYHVLGVRRSASNAELSQAYRTLARVYHPDRNIEDGSADIYNQAVTAYDTLISDGKRSDYDYMLDNPERVLYHYYQYYNRRYSPNVNIRGFISVIIIMISVMQYLYHRHTFSEAVKFTMHNPKERNRFMKIIEKEGILTEIKKKVKNKKSKDDFKKEEERVLRNMIENSMEVNGGYSRPKVVDTLIVQLLLSPYYFVCYMQWYVRWIWKFNYLKEEYGEVEKEYLTYKGLNMSIHDWKLLSDSSRQSYLDKELWIPENLAIYKGRLRDGCEQLWPIKLVGEGSDLGTIRVVGQGSEYTFLTVLTSCIDVSAITRRLQSYWGSFTSSWCKMKND